MPARSRAARPRPTRQHEREHARRLGIPCGRSSSGRPQPSAYSCLASTETAAGGLGSQRPPAESGVTSRVSPQARPAQATPLDFGVPLGGRETMARPNQAIRTPHQATRAPLGSGRARVDVNRQKERGRRRICRPLCRPPLPQVGGSESRSHFSLCSHRRRSQGRPRWHRGRAHWATFGPPSPLVSSPQTDPLPFRRSCQRCAS